MPEDIDADELLQSQILKNRANYNQRLVDLTLAQELTPTSYKYLGYDAGAGRHIIQPIGGSPLTVANVITTGALAVGQTIQAVKQGNSLRVSIDEVPFGSRPYGAGGGGAGAGGNQPSSGFFSGSGNNSEDSEPCGYKVINGEVEAQFECSEGDPDLFDNAEDAIASVTGATCANSTFPMTAPIAYVSPGDSVIQSVRVIDGAWDDGTRLNQTCPALLINEDRTTAGADFDTNYANNSGSCTYRICTKTLENNYGCVTEGGEARCAYFPDGSGSYKSLEECEEAIAPGFTGGQGDGILYSFRWEASIKRGATFEGIVGNSGQIYGPIGGTRIVASDRLTPDEIQIFGRPNSSLPQIWITLYNLGDYTLDLTDPRIFNINRVDGHPDVDGDPKKSCPA